MVPVIRARGDDVQARSGIGVTSDLDPELPRIGDDAELAIFRAAQESLANVVRHAGANRVHLTLGVEGDSVVLIVRDDGRGFPADGNLATFERAGHLGLIGMRERIAALGGTVTVDGSDGVTVRVRIPVRQPSGGGR